MKQNTESYDENWVLLGYCRGEVYEADDVELDTDEVVKGSGNMEIELSYEGNELCSVIVCFW